MAFKLLSLIFLALPFIGLVVGLILWLANGSKRGSGEMACGGCGYAVRGLEALNCPECGADLRSVGINRGRGNSGLRIVGIVLTSISGGVLLLGCLLTAFAGVAMRPSSVQSVPVQGQSIQSQSAPTTNTPPIISDEESSSDVETPTP